MILGCQSSGHSRRVYQGAGTRKNDQLAHEVHKNKSILASADVIWALRHVWVSQREDLAPRDLTTLTATHGDTRTP